MRVLVACEYSGIVRNAFLAAGHEALSCDLLPTEQPGPHYQGDVLDVLDQGWDLLIAHPPCTFLSNSGVKHLYHELTEADRAAGITKRYRIDEARWADMEDGAKFFNLLAQADIPRIAVENPVMHRYGIELTGGRASQFVQPYEYGHPESKRTGLRLKGLPPLLPTENVFEYMQTLPKHISHRVHYLSPGPDRWRERSRTFPGIAAAMAEQWGAL